MQQAAEDLAVEVRALAGVAEATASVRAIDWKDRPGDWRGSLHVVADSPDLEALPNALRPLVGEARIDGRPIKLSLLIPGGDGMAPVSIADVSPEVLATLGWLRALPEVLKIDGAAIWGVGAVQVTFREDVSVEHAVEVLRPALPAYGLPEVLTASWHTAEAAQPGWVSIDVTGSWPSSDVVDGISEIIALPSVKGVWASAVRPIEYGGGTVSVSSSDTAAVQEVIETIPTDHNNPTQFHVSVED